MAFDHPHQLNLKRSGTTAGRSFSDLPIIRDHRGRTIYRWDAYFITVSNDPMEMRKRDVWELAECLDAERVRAEAIRGDNIEARERRLAAIVIDPDERDGDRFTSAIGNHGGEMW